TVVGGEALGFSSNQASPQNAVLTGSAVTEPNVGAVTFAIDVKTIGGDVITVDVALTSELTGDNTTVAGLAADLNGILPAALLSNGFASNAVNVTATSTGELRIAVNDASIASLTIHGTAADLSKLGFTDGQTSVRTVGVTAAQPGPANGQVPADLVFTVTVQLADGQSIPLVITLSGADTAEND